MSTTVMHHIETRPILDAPLTAKQQAKADDAWVRDFDRRLRDWPELAQVCIRVDRNREWDLLGFRSYDAWLLDAAPFSRSMAYWAVGTFKQLQDDFSPEELRQMPNGVANVMKQLSPGARKNPKIREAASKKPREFIRTVKEQEPMQHIEESSVWGFSLTESQRAVVDKTFAAIREKEPELTDGAILEMLCASYWAS